jgi:hypothetical protein
MAPPDLHTGGQTHVKARAAQLRGAVAGEMRVATLGVEIHKFTVEA